MAKFELSAGDGGRLASLEVGGHELLVAAQPDREASDRLAWGAYPMVPWAGRIANGLISQGRFAGTQFPLNLGPHAIHGTGFTSTWTDVSANHMELALDEPWPFGGVVTHGARMWDASLELTLTIEATTQTMPAMLGWHPWFKRDLGAGGPPLEVHVDPRRMFELDDAEIPTGRLVDVPDGPWDNCFILKSDPVLTWPGHVELTLSSSCEYWVIYDQPEHAVCVEPQSGPPNQFNSPEFPADVLEPGQTLSHSFQLNWRLL